MVYRCACRGWGGGAGIYCKYVGHKEATNKIHVWRGGGEKNKQNCTNIGQKQTKKNTWFKTFILKLQSSKYVYCLFFIFFILKPLKLKKPLGRHRRRRRGYLCRRCQVGGASVGWGRGKGCGFTAWMTQHSLFFIIIPLLTPHAHDGLHHFL